MISPGAILHPPIAIGDFCQIMDGAQIGPYASISSGSIIAKNATVENSIISPDTYIGEMTEIKNAIVRDSVLVHPLAGVKITITDPLLLGPINKHSVFNLLNSLTHKTAAIWLLATLSSVGIPLTLISWLRTGKAIEKRAILGAGEAKDPTDVNSLPRFNLLELSDKRLPLFWYPTLINIIKGNMRFIGPAPVALDDFGKDKEILHNSAKYSVPPGLLPVEVIFDKDSDEATFAEAIYSKKHGLVQDFRFLVAALSKPIIGKKNARRLAGL
jgi:hypothetical protein